MWTVVLFWECLLLRFVKACENRKSNCCFGRAFLAHVVNVIVIYLTRNHAVVLSTCSISPWIKELFLILILINVSIKIWLGKYSNKWTISEKHYCHVLSWCVQLTYHKSTSTINLTIISKFQKLLWPRYSYHLRLDFNQKWK